MRIMSTGYGSTGCLATVGAIFKSSTFVIPGYQRPYEWGTQHVEQLTEDLTEHLERCISLSPEPGDLWHDYILNTVITVERSDGSLEVIDGQQRLITLLLMFAAMRDVHKNVLTPNWQQTLERWISDVDGETSRSRVDIEYKTEEVEQFFSNIVKGKPIDANPSPSSTAFALERAYHKLVRWSEDTFGTQGTHDPAKFLAMMKDHVRIAEIRGSRPEDSHQAFERANDRGKPLSSTDLIKSQVFGLANTSQDRVMAANTWRGLLTTLTAIENLGTPDEFFHHLMLADAAPQKIGRGKTRSIFKTAVLDSTELPDGTKVSSSSRVQAICSYLLQSAVAYANICNGKSPSGAECVPLSDLHKTDRFRRALRQFRQVLLAARFESETEVTVVAEEVERLVVTLTLSREYGTAANEIFAIAKALRENRAAQHPKPAGALVHKMVQEALTQQRCDRFWTALSQMSIGAGKSETRYLLGRIESYAREKRHRVPRNGYMSYVTKWDHVEHILPQSVPDGALKELQCSRLEAEHFVHHLGNLTIWKARPNQSNGDDPYSSKRQHYAKADQTITQLIATSFEESPASRALSKELSEHAAWTLDDLFDRHAQMCAILSKLILQKAPPRDLRPERLDIKLMLADLPDIPTGSNLVKGLNALLEGCSTTDEVTQHMGRSKQLAKATLESLVVLETIDTDGSGTYWLTEIGQLVGVEGQERLPAELAGLILRNERWKQAADSASDTGHTTDKKQAHAKRIMEWANKYAGNDVSTENRLEIAA